MTTYNPYDLLQLLINGKPITGRPFAFDSEVVNQKTMTNAFKALVKPTKVITICPDCGQGMELDVLLGDPPFPVLEYNCQQCRPGPPPLVDPFINPFTSGRVAAYELDPIARDPSKRLEVPTTTVAERFVLPVEELILNPTPAPVAPETAETELGEEKDFDDSDLIEDL